VSADIFDEFTKAAFGCGRLNPAVLDRVKAAYIADLRSGAERLIASAGKAFPKLPPIHFDFVATDEVNAWAFLHKGQHCIGVTAAAVLGMSFLFQRMLSDRRILRGIGDPTKCVEHPPLGLPLLPAIARDTAVKGPPPPPDFPRQWYYNFIVRLAFNFLFYHELGHILNGHVDWAVNRKHAPLVAELGWAPGSVEESIEMQALEMDADSFALAQAIGATGEWAKAPPGNLPHLQTYKELLFAWMFAAFSFFRLFGDEPLEGADLYGSSHPPYRVRLANVWEIVVRAAVGHHGADLFPTLDVVGNAGDEVEQAFHCLSGEPVAPRIRYVEGMFLPAAKEHKARLIRRWNGGLRDELLQYAYGVPGTYYERELPA
jgi:hypothetical protein